MVGYVLAWCPLASLLFLSYSTLPRRALLLTTSNELGPLNFLHAYWGLFISRICWSLYCLQSNLKSATMSQTKDKMCVYLNRTGNKYEVDYWYLYCDFLNLSLTYLLGLSVPCLLSVLPHETNRGFNCSWASLCVVLIIPSREPHRCSALKVQKLQRPVLTEPLWNNKLNGAHNKREGCMRTLANCPLTRGPFWGIAA